jgi:hypothetical protein
VAAATTNKHRHNTLTMHRAVTELINGKNNNILYF